MDIALGAFGPLSLPIHTRTGQNVTVTEGMDVAGADGVVVGQVKGANPSALLVDRALRRDVYVPFEAIDAVRDNRIILTIPAAGVDHMHWPHPDLM